MQQQSVEQWKKSAVEGASVTLHHMHDVAQEAGKDIGAVWRNADDRDDLIRTMAIAVGALAAVGVLVAITGALPLWLRLVVAFAVIGCLVRWVMTRIADDAD